MWLREGESRGAKRNEERASPPRSSLIKTGMVTPHAIFSLLVVLCASPEKAGLLLRGLPSPALSGGVRDLLEEVKLLTELEDVADTHHIHALFREFGNLPRRSKWVNLQIRLIPWESNCGIWPCLSLTDLSGFAEPFSRDD